MYEVRLPYEMEEKSIGEKNLTKFGFVRNRFLAHPKIDPENRDVYNIGFNLDTFDVYRMDNELKLIAQNNVKLRVRQTIHDCCLAGDYLVFL